MENVGKITFTFGIKPPKQTCQQSFTFGPKPPKPFLCPELWDQEHARHPRVRF